MQRKRDPSKSGKDQRKGRAKNQRSREPRIVCTENKKRRTLRRAKEKGTGSSAYRDMRSKHNKKTDNKRYLPDIKRQKK